MDNYSDEKAKRELRVSKKFWIPFLLSTFFVIFKS